MSFSGLTLTKHAQRYSICDQALNVNVSLRFSAQKHMPKSLHQCQGVCTTHPFDQDLHLLRAGCWWEPVTAADTHTVDTALCTPSFARVDRIFFFLDSTVTLCSPAWHDQSECEDPNYRGWPLGCVLICHIMNHLQHWISNIPSITGRPRVGFKNALLGRSAACRHDTHQTRVLLQYWPRCTTIFSI